VLKRSCTVTLNESDKAWVESVWMKLDKKRYQVSFSAYDKLPYTTENGVYSSAVNPWTSGFWPGMMWLMYVETEKEQYRKTAEKAEQLLDKFLITPWKLGHDTGFVWHISSGVNYGLFQKEDSKTRLLFAADHLASRYNCRGDYISSENAIEGRMIIDTMMNLPLLYLASEITQQKRYQYRAEQHASRTIQTHIRQDGSVFHAIDLNPDTGELVGYTRGQGYSEDSAWARGQTWALYGFTLSYIHSGKKEYLDVAKRVANFFIAAIADTYIPRVDLKAPALEHDTTAGAIAASGLIELANCVEEDEKHIYMEAAIKILRAMEEMYCDWSVKEESVLQQGVEKYFPEEYRKGHSIIYGDYFFTEAILKLKRNEYLFW